METMKMVLKCRCGWTGIQLIPDYENDTANCPTCGRPFKGIPAHRAEFPMKKRMIISLDDLHDGEFVGTSFDIGGRGHDIIILEENKDLAIGEMVQQFREKVERLFKPACFICDEPLDADLVKDDCRICEDHCPGYENCEECEYHDH